MFALVFVKFFWCIFVAQELGPSQGICRFEVIWTGFTMAVFAEDGVFSWEWPNLLMLNRHVLRQYSQNPCLVFILNGK